ncbi:hypothetical protein ACIN5098_2225 [Acinetobacter baumannii OIFC098]|nr:hypothetical protein ACIN5098_2225 [Acinetobacter baumannii OIFC098]
MYGQEYTPSSTLKNDGYRSNASFMFSATAAGWIDAIKTRDVLH